MWGGQSTVSFTTHLIIGSFCKVLANADQCLVSVICCSCFGLQHVNQGKIQCKVSLIQPKENAKTKYLVFLLLQDQIRQHIDVRLCRVALQNQRHHVVLIQKNLTELLS